MTLAPPPLSPKRTINWPPYITRSRVPLPFSSHVKLHEGFIHNQDEEKPLAVVWVEVEGVPSPLMPLRALESCVGTNGYRSTMRVGEGNGRRFTPEQEAYLRDPFIVMGLMVYIRAQAHAKDLRDGLYPADIGYCSTTVASGFKNRH